jgi:SEC-C motif domain protein
MRSRFAAYALGLVTYVQRTTHPDGPNFEADTAAWADGIVAFAQSTRFQTLSIIEHTQDGDTATVTFRAGLEQAGQDASFTERSTFARVNGVWLYQEGDPSAHHGPAGAISAPLLPGDLPD